MRLTTLSDAVSSHTGEFLCERINASEQTRLVPFRHVVTPPEGCVVPDVGRLRDFYDTFGSVTLYVDEDSGDAAVYIASPREWSLLEGRFAMWIEDIDDDERSEYLPDWIDDRIVIGEEPRTGNYLLVPTRGDRTGRIFTFDHDGFEFSDEAGDVVEFVSKLLVPDNSKLVEMASHMRFCDFEKDPMKQWWIRELTDNRGHRATTSA